MTLSADEANLARAALDSLTDPCAVLRPVRAPDGHVIDFAWVDVNHAACMYMGMSREALIGVRVSDTPPGAGAQHVFDEFVRATNTGERRVIADFEYVGAGAGVPFDRFDLHISPVDGHVVVWWRDSSHEHHQATALEEADRRYRILALHTSDIVIDCLPDGTITWVSPSVEKALGFRPAQWLGRRPRDLVAEEDRAAMLDGRDRVFESGEAGPMVAVRFFTVSGDYRWMTLRARGYGVGTQLDGVVMELHDVHHEVLLRRAVTTLSAANAILVRARDENELLADMCEVAVADAGYLFSWYGRPVDDDEQSVRAVASSALHREYLDDVRVSWGDGPLGRGPTGTCLRTGEPSIVHDFLVAEQYRPWHAPAAAHGFRSSLSLPVYVHGALDGAFMVYAAEPMAFDEQAVSVLTDLATQVGYGLARVRETRQLAQAVDDRRLLGTAIDQAAEAIVVTDQDAIIRYANPAALRISGYDMHEVLGQNPRIFGSGLHDERFYADMWHRLDGGQPWHGVIVNRRRDGELYEEEATIAPVHDDEGHRIAYVAVKHDLRRERELQEVVDRDQSDRDAIVEVMRDVRPGDSLEATSASLAAAVRRFENIDGCMIVMLAADGSAVPVAIAGSAIPELHSVGHPLHNEKLDLMVEMCRSGPWWMDMREPDGIAATDPEFRALMLQAGFSATAYAPIRREGETIGVVAVITTAADAEQWMPLRLGLLTEIGSFAGMLLGPQAAQRAQRESVRAHIAEVIATDAFRIVFEPVVHLPSGSVIGYEALTRFADGEPPDRRFDAAQAAGLGSELEAACARRALADAESLPSHAWLSVNFSPSSIIDGAAAEVVRGAARQVIIEITEHNAIDNYAAVRHAIKDCGNVLVAVDDAGSGFASLRHILELEPDIIKLDIALVRDIDTDPARQALAAGMRHFAALTGTTLIAEGVETESEARSIRQLGVELAQGYLFGHHDHRAGEQTT